MDLLNERMKTPTYPSHGRVIEIENVPGSRVGEFPADMTITRDTYRNDLLAVATQILLLRTQSHERPNPLQRQEAIADADLLIRDVDRFCGQPTPPATPAAAQPVPLSAAAAVMLGELIACGPLDMDDGATTTRELLKAGLAHYDGSGLVRPTAAGLERAGVKVQPAGGVSLAEIDAA